MAFAATPVGLSDIDGIANEDAIQVNFDLGIVTGNPDGTFLPTKAVTRAEFAAMITRALAIPDSALAGYTATTFKDTAGYSWAVPYLAFCQSKGIMLGDGMGNVMPGRTINTNEAVTMALRAIGYTANSAQLVGTWPSNYVTLAQNSDLYDDVANVTSVDKANAAQIIYNLLTVQKVAVNSDGETIAIWADAAKTEASNLLNTGLGAEATAPQVLVGDEDSKINLMPYAGAYVVAYEKSDEIVAIGEVKSDFLEGEYDLARNYFEVDDVDYKGVTSYSAITTSGVYLVNGDATTPMTTLGAVSGTSIKIAVDLSSKTINKIYSIAIWTADNTDVVGTADLEAIDDKELLGYDFIEGDDNEIDMNSFELVGVSSLDKIAKDNVVYVYANNDGDIKRVAVGTEVITGKVTEVDGSKYIVNGTKYSIADDSTATAPDAGDTITAKLDAYGDMYDIDVDGGDADTYGIIKAHAAAGISDEQVKLYTDADATTTFNIDDDATTTSTTGISIGGVGNLMGYGLNKDGKIDTINLEVTTAAGATLSSVTVLKAANGAGTVTSYPVASDVVVFTWDGTDYGVTTIDKVETAEQIDVAGFFQMILDDDGYVVAMVVNDAAAGKSATDTYAVLNKVTATTDADDDAIQRLIGLADGATFDKVTDDDNVITLNKTVIAAWKVDIDASGAVTTTSQAGVDATVNGVTTIAALNTAKTAVQVGTTWYAFSDNVVVYKAEKNDDGNYEYTIASTSSLRESYKISLFETDDDVDGYELVIFEK
ncbi:MAG TPA: S-layer homology domain-containing protein [Patescibacteria group bacterium]|nr:S-layer homology domain-containing protein [Patescibacteria group bacterium]